MTLVSVAAPTSLMTEAAFRSGVQFTHGRVR